MSEINVGIVYTTKEPKREITVNVLGVPMRFFKDQPRFVTIRQANVLKNFGVFKLVQDLDIKNGRPPQEWVKNILVARTLHSIGDMIMASVTPKALKTKYPWAKVTVAVPAKSFPLWFHNPWVDALIAWDELGKTDALPLAYDLYFDITRPCVQYESTHHPSKKQRIDIYMEHCGATLPNEDKQPFYLVTQEEREWAHEVTGGRFFFGLQLRANAPIRNWMPGQNCPQDRNKEIVRRWLELNNGVDVMLFDEHRELLAQYDDKRIFKRPGSSIRQVFALLERCVQMQTLDSGLLHGSGALGVPVVALFGNIHPQARTTYYKNARALFKPEACIHHRAPCNSDCGHQYCLAGITVDEAWGADLDTWKGPGKARLEMLKGIEAMNRGPINKQGADDGSDQRKTAHDQGAKESQERTA